jgi:SAM-dependent methyltransferase
MSSHVRSHAYAYLRCARGPAHWRAACLYFGAGLLNVEDFSSLSLARWELYGDEGTGLVPWEDDVYGSVIQPFHRVLLIGCGSGRDLLALRRRGCNVTGVEQSTTLAEMARSTLSQHGLPTLVAAEPIESYETVDTYDVIIFSPYIYSYIVGSASRIAVLARLRERLSSQGRVILSYVGLMRQSAVWIVLARISSMCARSDWRPEAGDRLYAPASHPHALGFEHQFRPDELARECRSAGLRIVRDEPISAFFRFAVAVL